MERTFGAVLTTGYFTFRMKTVDTDEYVATGIAYNLIASGSPVFGIFNMPGSPSHAAAYMRINPDHLIGVVMKPGEH